MSNFMRIVCPLLQLGVAYGKADCVPRIFVTPQTCGRYLDKKLVNNPDMRFLVFAFSRLALAKPKPLE